MNKIEEKANHSDTNTGESVSNFRDKATYTGNPKNDNSPGPFMCFTLCTDHVCLSRRSAMTCDRSAVSSAESDIPPGYHHVISRNTAATKTS